MIARKPMHLVSLPVLYWLFAFIVYCNLVSCSADPKQLPNMELVSLTGEKIKLSGQNNQPTLLTFWSSSCNSCIAEIPHFNRLYREFKEQGLNLVGIAMYYDAPIYVQQSIQRYGIQYPVSLDIDKQIVTGIFSHSQITTPTTLLTNGNGKIVYRITGKIDIQSMSEKIRRLLNFHPS